MSLDTYANLATEIALWLKRSDLTAEIPTFITLAEAQLNRRLRSTRMLTRNSSFAITGQLTALPSDFVGPRSLRITDGTLPGIVKWVSTETMDDLLDGDDQTSGQPLHYTVEGANFRFSPDPGTGTYTAAISYYQRLPALATNGTNWLLQAHPDAYLYGALMQSAPYLRADERLETWASIYTTVVDDINASDRGLGASLEILPNTYGAGIV